MFESYFARYRYLHLWILNNTPVKDLASLSTYFWRKGWCVYFLGSYLYYNVFFCSSCLNFFFIFLCLLEFSIWYTYIFLCVYTSLPLCQLIFCELCESCLPLILENFYFFSSNMDFFFSLSSSGIPVICILHHLIPTSKSHPPPSSWTPCSIFFFLFVLWIIFYQLIPSSQIISLLNSLK